MPCQNLFDQQSVSYKKKILSESKIKISIEAASTDCWKKYVGNDGLTFGIDTFGKSAPYQDIYKHIDNYILIHLPTGIHYVLHLRQKAFEDSIFFSSAFKTFILISS